MSAAPSGGAAELAAPRKRELLGLALLAPNILWLAFFMAGPLALLAIISFHGYAVGKGITDAWLIDNYTAFLTDAHYLEVLANSMLLGLIVTSLCVVLGYPLAYALSRAHGLARSLLYFVILLPLLTSAVVRTFGWMILLSNNGVINKGLMALGLTESPLRLMYNMSGVVIALTEVLLPFMVLALDAALLNIDASLFEAARNLGARSARIFLQITLPLTLPGVVSGSVLVFTLAISSFVTPSLVGGPKFKVMPAVIYQQSVFLSNWPFGAAIAFIMLFAILATLVLAFRLLRTRTAT